MWENDLLLPIHVTAARDRRTALCGERVLDGVIPPETIDLGARRRDGSEITLDEVELEAGWLATQPRHPNAAKLGDFCRGCLERVERLRTKAAAPKRTAAVKREAKKLERAQQKAAKHAAWEAKILAEYDE